MRIKAYIGVFLLMVIILSCTGELDSFSAMNNPKNVKNANLGSITLFSQNYSEINKIPNNIFIAKLQNNTKFDNTYSTVYGEMDSEILFENYSKELKYTTVRNSPLIPYSLLSYVDIFTCWGVIQWIEELMKPSNICLFCKQSSTPIINYIEQPRQAGALYICNLAPMVKCDYEISMDMNTDDTWSFVELDTPGSKLIIREIDNNTVLESYFQVDPRNIGSKTISIGNAKEKVNLKISFDGENKTNTIFAENGNCIITPFYNLDRQRLPYVDFSNGYIKFTPFVLGKGTYLNLNISNITQKTDRKFITPIGYSKMVAFGLDGPYPKNETGQGIDYLNSKGDSGTLWFDVESIAEFNQTDLDYFRSQVLNNSWEVGIHFSRELNSLPLDEAYNTMDKEYEYVYEKLGKKPTSWCCLRNNDNITHAIHAYNKLGMYWRNGESGVHAEKAIGNLDDDTWLWWEPASHAGMSHPVFSHQLDKDPADLYSISYSKFKNWVNNYESNNVSLVSFYEYSQISRNTYDANFDNINSSADLLSFEAHTNGIKCFINVNIAAENATQVYDRTSNKFLDYTVEQDNSITFWAENNHTYNVVK